MILPSIEIIKDIEDMLYTFIWKSSVNRVKKDIVQKEYQEGGLKMVNIYSFILSLVSSFSITDFQAYNTSFQN
jgi:hypothetical protein